MNFYEYPQCQEYSCIHTPYNDSTFYETLESSGSLSLGTTAGTNRSISAEFGGSTPHALSEYYKQFDFTAVICPHLTGTNVTIPLAPSSTSLSDVNITSGGAGYQCFKVCMTACSTNGNNSGITSGNPLEFSDFYGDSDSDPTHQVCFCIWGCYGIYIYTEGFSRLYPPYGCFLNLQAGNSGCAWPKVYNFYASSSSYLQGTIRYTDAAGTVYCSGVIKVHGG